MLCEKMVYGMFSEGTLNEETVNFILAAHVSQFPLLKRQVTFKVTLCENQVKIKIFFHKWQQIAQLFLVRKNDVS